mmetsp:Transcript_26543/g.44512  ORF Transcript_26543/g.44512 Transcript_26543/m.44512 type:complete len:571 (+) Transcript_26543:285-1997(+)
MMLLLSMLRSKHPDLPLIIVPSSMSRRRTTSKQSQHLRRRSKDTIVQVVDAVANKEEEEEEDIISCLKLLGGISLWDLVEDVPIIRSSSSSSSIDYVDSLMMGMQIDAITVSFAREEGGISGAKNLGVLVGFLCKYRDLMEELVEEFGLKLLSIDLQRLIPSVTAKYLDAINPRMQAVMMQIVITEKQLEEPPEETKEGHVYTHLGNDLFSVLQKQLSLAKRNHFTKDAASQMRLSAGYQVYNVQSLLLEWVSAARINSSDQTIYLPGSSLKEDKKEGEEVKKTEMHIAALINTAAFIEKHVPSLLLLADGERGRRRRSKGGGGGRGEKQDGDENAEITAVSERLKRQISAHNNRIVSAASMVLMRLVVETLRDLMGKLFTKPHISSGKIVGEIVATIYDYFSDFRRWIKERRHLMELMRSITRRIIAVYIEALTKNHRSVTWDDNSPALVRMASDRKDFRELMKKVKKRALVGDSHGSRPASSSSSSETAIMAEVLEIDLDIFAVLRRLLLAKSVPSIIIECGSYLQFFMEAGYDKAQAKDSFQRLLAIKRSVGRKTRLTVMQEHVDHA